MASAAFTIKQGDLLPSLRATLTQGLAQDPIDLTGTTVQLRYRISGKNVEHTKDATILVPEADGVVEVEWESGDTDDVAVYQAEFVITHDPGGTPKQQTVPNEGCFLFEVEAACGSTC